MSSVQQGFLDTGTTFITPIGVQGSMAKVAFGIISEGEGANYLDRTEPFSINTSGHVIGASADPVGFVPGFLDTTQIDYPGVFATDALGTNDSRQIIDEISDGRTSTQGDPATVNAAAVPEPATLALLGLGLAGLSFAQRKRS